MDIDLPILTFGNIAKRDLRGTPHPVAEPRQHTRRGDRLADPGPRQGDRRRRQLRLFVAGRVASPLPRDLGLHRRDVLRPRPPAGLSRASRTRHPDLPVARAACRTRTGRISNPAYDASKGIVFDTGQVLHGLVRGFEETGDAEILAAAEKAADWLTTVADGEKRWTRNTHNGIPHVYNTRSAWALLRLHKHRPTAATRSRRPREPRLGALARAQRLLRAERLRGRHRRPSPTRSPTRSGASWNRAGSWETTATSRPPRTAPGG